MSGGETGRDAPPKAATMAPMSDLKDRLRSDLTASIKARDEVRSSTLRMVLAAITNAEVAGKVARELDDDDIIGVLSTEAKKRREAATAFSDAGRTEPKHAGERGADVDRQEMTGPDVEPEPEVEQGANVVPRLESRRRHGEILR